jgi:ligand-binding SRPBCC domain-containing protein
MSRRPAYRVPVLDLTTRIRAPRARCFDLARSVDVHLAGAADTGERAVAGVTRGLLGPGDEVTWRARHFGVRQRLTSRITAFDPPHHFRDSMVRGAFARFDHDHFFAADGDVTVMRDVFDFTSPLGRLFDALVLTRHMRAFLRARNEGLRRIAESDRWRAVLPA